MNEFKDVLSEWYSTNKRWLPWKQSFDAYSIWLSEVILQQTRIEQGTPYYLKFIKQYPTVVDLANDSIDNVLKLWEGLGYYSRARNMHHTAQLIKNNYNGVFPSTFEEIRKLKGIGDYTASAIASFAFQLPYAVVDGNVFRVLSRIFGINTPIDSNQGKLTFKQKAQDLLDKENPARHNQAIMDFGSLVCTPKNPKCSNCPFVSNCVAYQQDRVSFYPIKSKKIIKKDRHLHYFVCNKDSVTILHHRNKQDIWKHLYDFPHIETASSELSKNDLKKYKLKKLPSPSVFKQTLTHQNIYAYFYELNYLIDNEENHIEVPLYKIEQYTFPKIIKNYLKNRNLYLP